MNTPVLIISVITLIMFVGLMRYHFRLERQKRELEEFENLKEMIRKIHNLDDTIARRKRENPTGWAKDFEGKRLVAERVVLFEEYCEYTKSHPIREVEYLNELLKAGIS